MGCENVELSFKIEDAGEASFVFGIIDSLYQEAQKEIELCKKSGAEDAEDDVEFWANRVDKYKLIGDVLEKYIEIEDNKVWVFVKNPVAPPAPTEPPKPRKCRVAYTALPCSYCGSTNTRGFGYRKNTNKTIPIRWCRDCERKYTNKDGTFFKMKFSKEIIERAIKLHGDGMSTRDVADFILQNYHAKVSNASVSIWSRDEKLIEHFKLGIEKPIEQSASVVENVVVKPELEMFRENGGFDYRAKTPKRVGQSEVYHSGTGKVVIRHSGKGCRGEIVLTTEKDVERLLGYDKKDFDWCIKTVNPEKQNILRGYLRDLRLK